MRIADFLRPEVMIAEMTGRRRARRKKPYLAGVGVVGDPEVPPGVRRLARARSKRELFAALLALAGRARHVNTNQ